MILRRTKIVTTLGPATDSPDILFKMMDQGVDLVRLNFSHGTAEDHIRRVQNVRAYSQNRQRVIGIIADLQGPKIRIAKFKNGSVALKKGASFILNAALANDAGDEHQVGLDYKNLPEDVKAGDTLLLDDGRIVFHVEKVEDKQIFCCVEVPGILSNNKGLNRLGGGLSAPAITEKDKKDINTAVQLQVDYIAISFPRSAADIHEARNLVSAAGGDIAIMAKIERAEAIDTLDEIIQASDAVMVARGDLGVEIGDAELPSIQKDIIHRCRSANKPVLTATQMMESMIHNSIPTRAEVFDVANAVLDATDAVMLSGETASGEHPDKVVEAMARICLASEKSPIIRTSRHRVECHFERSDEAIAMAAMYVANHLDIEGIIALTESGRTPLWMSRIRSAIPIYALCRSAKARGRMTLYRGVYPIPFDVLAYPPVQVNEEALKTVKEQGYLKKDELVILSHGDYLGVHGGTNAMKILSVT